MDSEQLLHQEIMSSQTLESILDCSQKSGQEKKPRPADMQAQKCPRCDSSNTKFCYYNNYSLSQPRYFCKSCRRYWTKGGTLRNVPVGGGCRKNKRPSSSSKRTQDQPLPIPPSFVNPLSSFQKPFGSDETDSFSIWGSYPDRYGLGLGGFLDNPSQQNFYYENNQLGVGGNEMTMIPYEEVKQEGTRWFPWQGGDGNVSESWNGNGIVSNNWHGLLNSPLM